jgi:hypothetical protein
MGSTGPCPVFASYTLAFALQLRKKHGKPSFRLVEKCPDIPVAFIMVTEFMCSGIAFLLLFEH